MFSCINRYSCIKGIIFIYVFDCKTRRHSCVSCCLHPIRTHARGAVGEYTESYLGTDIIRRLLMLGYEGMVCIHPTVACSMVQTSPMNKAVARRGRDSALKSGSQPKASTPFTRF